MATPVTAMPQAFATKASVGVIMRDLVALYGVAVPRRAVGCPRRRRRGCWRGVLPDSYHGNADCNIGHSAHFTRRVCPAIALDGKCSGQRGRRLRGYLARFGVADPGR